MLEIVLHNGTRTDLEKKIYNTFNQMNTILHHWLKKKYPLFLLNMNRTGGDGDTDDLALAPAAAAHVNDASHADPADPSETDSASTHAAVTLNTAL